MWRLLHLLCSCTHKDVLAAFPVRVSAQRVPVQKYPILVRNSVTRTSLDQDKFDFSGVS
jgi:hypothetical protein